MIRQGKGGHLEMDSLIHQIADFASAVKKAVFTVDVKVDKIIITHREIFHATNYRLIFFSITIMVIYPLENQAQFDNNFT